MNLRDAARDKPCQVRMPGVCNGRTDTTVLAHIGIAGTRGNRRSNLRPACRSINSHNREKKPGCSSRFMGVSWSSHKDRWVAQIRRDRFQKNIGHFHTELQAALAYDHTALRLYGPTANINLICLKLHGGLHQRSQRGEPNR